MPSVDVLRGWREIYWDVMETRQDRQCMCTLDASRHTNEADRRSEEDSSRVSGDEEEDEEEEAHHSLGWLEKAETAADYIG